MISWCIKLYSKFWQQCEKDMAMSDVVRVASQSTRHCWYLLSPHSANTLYYRYTGCPRKNFPVTPGTIIFTWMDDCDWMLSVEKACDWLRIEPGVTWKFFLGHPVDKIGVRDRRDWERRWVQIWRTNDLIFTLTGSVSIYLRRQHWSRGAVILILQSAPQYSSYFFLLISHWSD